MYQILIFLFAFVLTAQNEDGCLISGKIINATGGPVKFSQVNNALNNDENVFRINYNSHNEFTTIIMMDNPGFYNVSYKNNAFTIYCVPGKQLGIEFDATKSEQAPIFSLDLGGDNQLLHQYRVRYLNQNMPRAINVMHSPVYLDISKKHLVQQHNLGEYIDYYKTIYQRKKHDLTNTNFSHVELKTYLWEENHYWFGSKILNAQYLIESLTQKDVHKMVFELDYLKHELSSLPNDLLTDNDYWQYVNSLLRFNANDVAQDSENVNEYAQTDYILEGETKWLAKAKMILYSLRNNDFSIARDYYVDFYLNNPHPEYTEIIEREFGSRLHFLEGYPAPDFVFPDEDGAPVSLSDFEGKVVYLKFWASWCKPCITDFEKNTAFRKELETLGVVLLNISIDDHDILWRNALQQYEIDGINILAQDDDQLRIDYQVGAVPAYYVINKGGGFEYRHDNQDFLDYFKGLINE